MSAMPRPSQATRELFQSMLPLDGRVEVKPMFGQLAAFVNGNMFSGLYGDDIFVRPSEGDRATLVGEHGATEFAPMAGRPMKGYVVLPGGWREEPARLREWVERALDATAELPAKSKEAKGKGAKRGARAR